VHYGGKWWLFCNISRSELVPNYCLDLHVFFTDDPVNGDWVPHDLNPVVTDCRRARMGGAFITSRDGRLLRMAQSNSRTYGESLSIMRIDRLSQSEYDESRLHVFCPDWKPNLLGTHHLCMDGDMVAMDAKRFAPKLWG
jgi:hypothetical protein